MRIGQGYDAHRPVEERKLMLDGIDIPYEKGSLGHSGADVLLHAISDVLLGAAAFGDIGVYFPDSNSAHSGADSAELPRAVGNLTCATGYEIGDIDSTVVCQAPKPAPHIGAMRAWIVEVLALPTGAVDVKVSSEEHMGFTGRGGGIAVHAMCLLMERTKRKFTIR